MLLIPSWNGTKGEWKALIKGAGKVKPGLESGLRGNFRER